MLILKLKIFYWKLFGRKVRTLEDFLVLVIANKVKISQVFIQIQSEWFGNLSKESIHIIAHHASWYKIVYRYEIPELCDEIDFGRVLLRAVEFQKDLKQKLGSKSVYLLDTEGNPIREDFIRECRTDLEGRGVFFPDSKDKRQWI